MCISLRLSFEWLSHPSAEWVPPEHLEVPEENLEVKGHKMGTVWLTLQERLILGDLKGTEN